MPTFEGNLSPNSTKFAPEKLETLRYHTVKTAVSISPGFESVPGRDRRTDRQTELR